MRALNDGVEGDGAVLISQSHPKKAVLVNMFGPE